VTRESSGPIPNGIEKHIARQIVARRPRCLDSHQPERVTERRQARRYPVSVPVELQGGRGLTREVSTSGMFFETKQSLSPGSLVHFSLLLEHAHPRAPLRMECVGQIVRVEPRDDRLGVAAALLRFRFEPADQARS